MGILRALEESSLCHLCQPPCQGPHNLASPTGMALSVLVVLLLAVLYEGIKVAKAKLLHRALVSMPASNSQQLIEDTDQDSIASNLPSRGTTRLR